MEIAKNYNLLVIGAGPGGYVAAIRAAQLGMKTAVIERGRLGGLCLNWGCIPTKALLKSAELYETVKKGGAYGLKTDGISYDLGEIVDRSRGITDRIVSGVEYLFKKHKIDSIKGDAKITSPTSVQITNGDNTETYTAEHILIATGAHPRALPGVTSDGERIITSKEAMMLKELPEKLVVIGAGAIGMEFAYYYQCLGSQVTVLEAKERVLPIEDEEISKQAARSFKRRGVKIETQADVKTVERQGDSVQIQYKVRGNEKNLSADVALVAIGVVGNSENLGLEENGIKAIKGNISVNEHMQTAQSNIYAIGDVIGPPWLAHIASAEGVHAVEHMAGHHPALINYEAIPGCIYCRPHIASVGYTEQRAKEEGIEYEVGSFSLKASGRAIATGDADGLVKLIFEKQYKGLIGAHIIGGEATEMIHELALAIRMEATADDIGHTVHAHPTLGESIMEAALDVLGERIHGA